MHTCTYTHAHTKILKYTHTHAHKHTHVHTYTPILYTYIIYVMLYICIYYNDCTAEFGQVLIGCLFHLLSHRPLCLSLQCYPHLLLRTCTSVQKDNVHLHLNRYHADSYRDGKYLETKKPFATRIIKKADFDMMSSAISTK